MSPRQGTATYGIWNKSVPPAVLNKVLLDAATVIFKNKSEATFT